MSKTNHTTKRDFDFALIVAGVPELTEEVENALFEAGCDDATLTIRYGLLYAEFSRESESLQDAILSAIGDIEKANVGAVVQRVDECNLVSLSDIARKVGRTRQNVQQYATGRRGPGGFPAPEFYLTEGTPMWSWCGVSYWLAENQIMRPEESWNAEVVCAINAHLFTKQQRERSPELLSEIEAKL